MSDLSGTPSQVLQDFLAEAEEIVEQTGSELADLADMAELGEYDPALLNAIFRGAHSLKGLAGMFGFRDVAALAHNMEELLDRLRLGKLTFTRQLTAVLSDAHELLRTLVHSHATGKDAEFTGELDACVTKINACLADSETLPGAPRSPALILPEHIRTALTEYEEHRLRDNLAKGRRVYSLHTSFELNSFDTELSAITDVLKESGEVVSTLPSVGENLDTHIDFEILFGTCLDLLSLKALVARDSVIVTLLSGAASAERSSHEQDGDVPLLVPSEVGCTSGTGVLLSAAPPEPVTADVAPVPVDTPVSARSMSRTVRVDIGKLDELMNIVGELVLAHSAIADVATKVRNGGYSPVAVELGKAAKGLERKLSELQKGVMEIRMIPVGQLYEKMSRIARSISREQGKQVDLEFVGAETELDKLIVEDISDPMMHIIRNAIDHGIEPGDERRAAGKSERGTIRISSVQKGHHVVIEIRDDGAGIDVEKVKAKALEKGLVSDVRAVSDRDAIEYIFMPGFSTNESVNEFSGRGVGMDVVKNNISAISGMVDVETMKGVGSCFTMTLPITLAIIKALIVRCCGRTYALPITSVRESLLVTDRQIVTVERSEMVQLRDSTLPLLRLERFFDISARQPAPQEFYVVVVGVAEKRLGIVVDELICQQDIVIKSLGEPFKRCKGISGAADLGDLSTILVLDIGSIVTAVMHGELNGHV